MAQTWVRMQLVPLPTSSYPELLVYWNPDSGDLVGEQTGQIDRLIEQTLAIGLSGFELSDPYRKPSELAAILSQHYVVIPEPVSEVPSAVLDATIVH